MGQTAGKFYIKDFGCKINQYDSRLLSENLKNIGKSCVNSPEHADIIIINTCSVTNRSESKERSYIRKVSRRYPDKEILTIGCSVRRYKGNFKFGAATSASSFIYLDNPRTRIKKFKGHSRGFITIQHGCRGNCTYCLVRQIKKPYYVKNPSEVIEEAKGFLENHKELVLCATNSAEYIKLDELILGLANMKGNFRWRFSSLNPLSLTEKNIELLSRDKRFCSYFHIPIQSANNSVLKKMNRGYDMQKVGRVIDNIKKNITGAVFAFDVIVGFPGESESCFTDTLDFIEETKPVKVHIFRFSNCKGTKAYEFQKSIRVDEFVKRERMEILRNMAEKIREKHFKDAVGAVKEVAVEKNMRGYTRDYMPIIIKGADAMDIKALEKVRITGISGRILTAVIV